MHYFLFCNKSVTAASLALPDWPLVPSKEQGATSTLPCHPQVWGLWRQDPILGVSAIVSKVIHHRLSPFSNGNSWKHFLYGHLAFLHSTSSVFPSWAPTFCLPLINSGISSAEPLTKQVPVLLATIWDKSMEPKTAVPFRGAWMHSSTLQIKVGEKKKRENQF